MKVVKAHEVKLDLMKYAKFERNAICVVTEGLRNADVLSISNSNMATEFEVKVSKSDLDRELAAIEYASREAISKAPAVPATPEMQQMGLELDGLKQKAGGWSKIKKHEEQFDPKAYFVKHGRYYWIKPYLPNYFYMVVPDRLAQYTAEKLAGSKYGVIAYDGCRQEGNHCGWKAGDNWWRGALSDVPEGAKWLSGAPCGDYCIREITVKRKALAIHKDKLSDEVLGEVLRRLSSENIMLLSNIINQNNDQQEVGSRG